jgi:hypothetical protein
MRIPSSVELDGYVNKHISKICTCSFDNDADNHCAHFVCHVLQLNFGQTCFGLTGKGDKKTAANVRVHEVFPKCLSVGKWDNKPATLKQGLIFVTDAKNVNLTSKQMANVQKKHIGIFIGSDVWQYKNAVKHVVKQTPAIFKKHYSGSGIEIFYGEFPI